MAPACDGGVLGEAGDGEQRKVTRKLPSSSSPRIWKSYPRRLLRAPQSSNTTARGTRRVKQTCQKLVKQLPNSARVFALGAMRRPQFGHGLADVGQL